MLDKLFTSEVVWAIYGNVIKYRETQAKKYFAESTSDYTNYDRAEKYKHRVRVVDLVLKPVEGRFVELGWITRPTEITEIP